MLSPGGALPYPPVIMLGDDEIFNCDLFFVLHIGGVRRWDKTVAMCGWHGLKPTQGLRPNMQKKKARKAGFAGIFGVVSDPVDLLCKTVFLESNRDEAVFWTLAALPPNK